MEDEKLTYSIEEAAAVLGIGYKSCAAAIKAGSIPCLVIGRRKLIPRLALKKMLAGESEKEPMLV